MNWLPRSPAPSLGAALLLALACPACCSEREAWSFPLSRAVYPEMSRGDGGDGRDRHRTYLADREGSSRVDPVLAVLVLPLLIDIALLPLTGAHDVLQPLWRR